MRTETGIAENAEAYLVALGQNMYILCLLDCILSGFLIDLEMILHL